MGKEIMKTLRDMKLKSKLILDSGVNYKYDTEKDYPVFINFDMDKIAGTARIFEDGTIEATMIDDDEIYKYMIASYGGFRDESSFTIKNISLITETK